MTGLVVVDEDVYEKQGWKYVLGAEAVLKVPPGQVRPAAGDYVRDGEPSFEVRLPHPVRADEDVPDCLGLALRTVANRLCEVAPDGSRDKDGLWVEAFIGPVVHEGALVLWLDTDGQGFTREMIEAMGSVFVEELTPCGIRVAVSAGPSPTKHRGSPWMSSAERNSEGRELP